MTTKILFRVTLLCLAADPLRGATIVNGSFESGSLSGWSHGGYSDFFYGPAARLSGERPTFADFFTTQPTDGSWVFSNTFDSDASSNPWLGQQIGIIQSGDVLRFDYRIGWDYTQGPPATMDRTFLFEIFDVNTNLLLQREEVFRASVTQPTFLDTGPLSHSIDLTSFEGLNARVQFVLNIPQPHTGPGHFQLDNVLIVPEPSIPLLFLLSCIGLGVHRHRPTCSPKTGNAQQAAP